MNWLSWQLCTHECYWCLLQATVGSQLKTDYFQGSLVRKNAAVYDYKAAEGTMKVTPEEQTHFLFAKLSYKWIKKMTKMLQKLKEIHFQFDWWMNQLHPTDVNHFCFFQ